jgi:hypothetical protein
MSRVKSRSLASKTSKASKGKPLVPPTTGKCAAVQFWFRWIKNRGLSCFHFRQLLFEKLQDSITLICAVIFEPIERLRRCRCPSLSKRDSSPFRFTVIPASLSRSDFLDLPGSSPLLSSVHSLPPTFIDLSLFIPRRFPGRAFQPESSAQSGTAILARLWACSLCLFASCPTLRSSLLYLVRSRHNGPAWRSSSNVRKPGDIAS